jgi:hypothetical protein
MERLSGRQRIGVALLAGLIAVSVGWRPVPVVAAAAEVPYALLVELRGIRQALEALHEDAQGFNKRCGGR